MYVPWQVHKDKVTDISEASDQRRQPYRCAFSKPDKHAAQERDKTDPAQVPTVLIEQRTGGVRVLANEAFGIHSVCNGLHRARRIAGDDNDAGKNMDGTPNGP